MVADLVVGRADFDLTNSLNFVVVLYERERTTVGFGQTLERAVAEHLEFARRESMLPPTFPSQ